MCQFISTGVARRNSSARRVTLVYYEKNSTILPATEPESTTSSAAAENHCLKTADLCDGWVDCPDHADEQNCGMLILVFLQIGFVMSQLT